MNPFTGFPDFKEKKLTEDDKTILLDDDKWLFELALKLNIHSGGASGGGGGGAVDSVNGQTGTVVLTSDDVTEGSTNLYSQWEVEAQFFSSNPYIRPNDPANGLYIGDATTVPLIFSGEIAIFESDNTGGTYYPIVNHGSGVGAISVMVGTHGTSDAPTYKDSNQILGGYAFGGMNDSSTAYGLAGIATGIWGIVDNTVSGSTIPMSLHLGALPLFSTTGLRITSANDILFYTQGGGSGAVVARADYSDNRFYFGTGDNSWFDNSGTLTINGAYTFPTSDGTANQVLKTDGAGTVTWGTPDLPLTDLTPAGDVTIGDGYSGYATDYYEIADGYTLTVGVGSVMEIG